MSTNVDQATLDASLLGSHTAAWSADCYYGGVPTLTGLPLLPTGTVDIDASGQIQTSANLYLASDKPVLDRDGNTLAPNDITDYLAPYGQEIVLSRTTSLGAQVFSTVVMATLRITDVPTIEQTRRLLGPGWLADSVYLQLSLKDRFDKILGDDFSELSSPASGATTWSEVQRLSTVPVQSVGDDTPASPTAVYSGSKLDAITTLLANIAYVPYMTRQGVLTGQPVDPMGAPYAVMDLTGFITDQSNSLSNNVNNRVVTSGASAGSQQLVGLAQVVNGPLSVYGEFGVRTQQASNPLAVTQQAVDATSATYLAQNLASQAKQVVVSCLLHLALDIGDVAKATDPRSGRVEVGVVTGISYSLDPTDLAKVTLSIPQGV